MRVAIMARDLLQQVGWGLFCLISVSFISPQQAPLPDLNLTPEERQWLERHETIRWGVVPGYAPFESVAFDYTIEGYTPDLFRYVVEHLGLRIDTVYASTWPELVERAERGQIDVISTAVRGGDDASFPLRIGEPYLSLPDVLIMRQGNEDVRSLADLEGKILAVGAGWAINRYLLENYPGIRLRPVGGIREALLATAFGEADAVVGTLPNATYHIERERITNLQVVATTDFQVELAFAVRHDWPHLASILDKAIAALPADVKDDLERRWIRLEQPRTGIDPIYWRWIIIGFVLTLLLLGGVWIWNRSLLRLVEHRTYALRVAKEEAEASTRVVSNILATVSHEIRTPLSTIMGITQMFEDEAVVQDRRWMLKLIQESSERLLRTMESVLELSTLEAGALRLNPRAFDLRDVVAGLAVGWRGQATAKALALHLDLPETRIPVTLDQTAVERILENLVQNALKFTAQGSVTVRVRDEENALRIEVLDSGIGFAPAFREQIFEPFRQESEGLSRQFEGVGLGLAITRSLVLLMGGTIAVESEQGVGTRFEVRLPPARA